MAVFIPSYFSPISQFSELINSAEICFEIEDHYEKQSYRNRCYIFGANGKQALNIPVKFAKTATKKKSKDALVDNDAHWQSHHLKSLQAAYSNSPFFEFYIDDLLPVFEKKYRFLLDVNLDTFQCIADAIELEVNYTKSTEYMTDINHDYRDYALVKTRSKAQKKYIQMFDDKHGFLPNLSILDLLFMEGPNTINLL